MHPDRCSGQCLPPLPRLSSGEPATGQSAESLHATGVTKRDGGPHGTRRRQRTHTDPCLVPVAR
eukprot:4071243-Prymnesium_polylepis.2